MLIFKRQVIDKQSRRDDTLLTVGAIYGRRMAHASKVPHGTTQMKNPKMSSLQDLDNCRQITVGYAFASPTVNKMPSHAGLFAANTAPIN